MGKWIAFGTQDFGQFLTTPLVGIQNYDFLFHKAFSLPPTGDKNFKKVLDQKQVITSTFSKSNATLWRKELNKPCLNLDVQDKWSLTI
jgi:hypothetical protein